MKKCKVKNCTKDLLAKGYCSQHYQYWKKYGVPFTKRSLEQVAKYGKGYVNSDGYRMFDKDGKKVREHRWLMEQHLGRKLLATEHIHHINEDKLDNRIENLKIVDNYTHKLEHLKEYKNGIKSCSRCGKIKSLDEFAFRINTAKSKFRRRFYDSWCKTCTREVNAEYKKKSMVDVKCSKCGKEFSKRKDLLKSWSGKCRSCAMLNNKNGIAN